MNLALLLLPMFAAGDANWPQFRGLHGDGHAAARDLPVQWSEEKKRPLEDGHPRQGLGPLPWSWAIASG